MASAPTRPQPAHKPGAMREDLRALMRRVLPAELAEKVIS